MSTSTRASRSPDRSRAGNEPSGSPAPAAQSRLARPAFEHDAPVRLSGEVRLHRNVAVRRADLRGRLFEIDQRGLAFDRAEIAALCRERETDIDAYVVERLTDNRVEVRIDLSGGGAGDARSVVVDPLGPRWAAVDVAATLRG